MCIDYTSNYNNNLQLDTEIIFGTQNTQLKISANDSIGTTIKRFGAATDILLLLSKIHQLTMTDEVYFYSSWFCLPWWLWHAPPLSSSTNPRSSTSQARKSPSSNNNKKSTSMVLTSGGKVLDNNIVNWVTFFQQQFISQKTSTYYSHHIGMQHIEVNIVATICILYLPYRHSVIKCFEYTIHLDLSHILQMLILIYNLLSRNLKGYQFHHLI